jgi:DNA phosphorothioation-associated putative methyltransferase
MELYSANVNAVDRGRTAMRRYTCSRPVALALSDELIKGTDTFFDFGCGHGGDINYLRRRKISATGWDPFHLPDNPIVPADIVNLGFVLNVIEDTNERNETLRVAFNLARKLLIVSVRVEHGLGSAAEFGDGIITSKGTFQKIYDQAEFKEYVESILNHKIHVAGIGVVYVFADSETESEFLAAQAFSRRFAYRTELIEEFARDTAGKKFIQLANNLGRVPLPSEFKNYHRLIDRFGSPHRIERLTLAKIDPSAFEGSKSQKREDLLTYMAMIRLQGLKVPPLRLLPAAIQADLRSLWRDYHSALSEAESFLFSIGRPEVVKDAFARVKDGKLVFDDLYIHRSLEEELPPLIRLMTFAGRQIVGDIGHNVIKLSVDGRKVSFLYYDNFDDDPHPSLRFGMRVYLPKATYQLRDFSNSLNPPILHRKDSLVSRSYPYYTLFRELTIAEEQAGLLSRSGIGFRRQWEELLDSLNIQIEGHTLRNSARIRADGDDASAI